MSSFSQSIRSRLGSSVAANDACCQMFKSTKCHVEGLVASRVIMLAHCVLILYSSICAIFHDNAVISAIVGAVIIVEAGYLIVRNNGADFYW